MSLRERNRLRTLAAIQQAARRLFAERGYHETRTRDIAEAAGIATGTLFNYAPTKEAVVLLVWKGRAREAADEGLAAAARAADPVAAVDAVFAPILTMYDEDRELGRIFLQAAVFDGADDPEVVALNTGFIGEIAGVIGRWSGHDSMLAAANVFAAYYLVVTGLLNGQLPDVPAARATLAGLVSLQVTGWSSSG
jgi:AcrR family transcriptional regulator